MVVFTTTTTTRRRRTTKTKTIDSTEEEEQGYYDEMKINVGPTGKRRRIVTKRSSFLFCCCMAFPIISFTPYRDHGHYIASAFISRLDERRQNQHRKRTNSWGQCLGPQPLARKVLLVSNHDAFPGSDIPHDDNDEEDAITTTIASTSSTASGGTEATAAAPGVHPMPAIYEAADHNDYRYSASDWLQNMRSIPRSTILRSIKFPVLSVVAWAAFVSLVHRFLNVSAGASIASRICVGSKPHSFLVSALGLLLVFRTNSAYQRFAEGRRIWERILSVSRNITRMALLYENELSVNRRCRVFRLLAAFPYLLHHHIQPQCDSAVKGTRYGLPLLRIEQGPPDRRVNGYPSPSSQARTILAAGPTGDSHTQVEREEDILSNICWVDKRNLPWCLFPEPVQYICAQATNRPLWICDRLSQEINEVAYTPNFTSRERLTFLSHIDKLSQSIGECERIHQTAVPLNYARHSLRSLTLWLFTLPFALVGDFGLLTGPVMALASWLLYGIYQIGYQIEDPFQGSLRLNYLCDAIYRDVMYGTGSMKRRVSAFSETEEEQDAWTKLDLKLQPSTTIDDSVPRP